MTTRETDVLNCLTVSFRNFAATFGLDSTGYSFDFVTAGEISRRFWIDIERVQQFHGIEHADVHKIAGYLAYWISKLKPVSVRNMSVYRGNAGTPSYVNETFALYVSVGQIESYFMALGVNKHTMLERSFVNSFTYTLKYRSATRDMLSTIFYFIERTAAE